MTKLQEKKWREQVAETQTDEFLLAAFPEAPLIIKEKIDEFEKSLQITKDSITEFRKAIYNIAIVEHKNSFFVWFWSKAYIRYMIYPEYRWLKLRLIKLQRQYKKMLPNNPYPLTAKEDFKDLIDQAKEVLIEEIVSLEKTRTVGNRIMAKCPLHEERTGSFVIYLNNNTWHCFGACGIGGDSIDLVMRLKKLEFKEAVTYLT